MRTYSFSAATPVWLGDPTVQNALQGFYADVNKPTSPVTLALTASTFYRLFVNGSFLHAGPARCAKGFFRVDEIDLTPYLTQEKNRIAIEVTGYNCNSFAYLRQPSFFQGELRQNGTVIAATGSKEQPFFGIELTHRVQKTPRYSYQRPYTEVYLVTPHTDDWRTDLTVTGVLPATVVGGTWMQRGLPLHTFPRYTACWYAQGCADDLPGKSGNFSQRYIDPEETNLDLFSVSELETKLQNEVNDFTFTLTEETPKTLPWILPAGSYADGTLGKIKTGFFTLRVTVSAPTELYLFFSEKKDRTGAVNPTRTGECIDAVKWTLTEAGDYTLRTAEPYGAQVVRLIAKDASVTVKDFALEAYEYPATVSEPKIPVTPKLQKIYQAAKESFIQNAADIFMDCPTRERAGWLCDSFFEGRVEWMLNRDLCVEQNFIENFGLPKTFEDLPHGMLPMCYPADIMSGEYIPQWSIWFFLEVQDYARRGGDQELVASLRQRYEDLYAFFCQYENELGLLESLPSWNFVEWSFANQLTQDVNYPTNMLYTAFLRAGAELYGKTELTEKAQKIAQTVREHSFDGSYFRDRDLRKDGVLTPTPDCTETCQYYAFFFEIATPETYPELWQKLITVFGPDRDAEKIEPQIHRSNAFIGNYLRLDVLRRYGLKEKMLSEIEGYFYAMATETGTLWEHMSDGASCDHGFASYVIYLMCE